MLGIIFSAVSISAGILLAMSTLDRWDGEKDFFKKIGNYLTPYNTIIGGALLAIGVLYFRSRGILYSAVAITGGLLLLTDILGKAPVVGELLVKASKALVPFKVGIGLASLAIGILNLF